MSSDLALLSDHEIDAMLFAQVGRQWRKVASVIAQAMGPFENWDEERVALRMRAIVDDGKIETAGDIRMWRFSEVRLRQERD